MYKDGHSNLRVRNASNAWRNGAERPVSPSTSFRSKSPQSDSISSNSSAEIILHQQSAENPSKYARKSLPATGSVAKLGQQWSQHQQSNTSNRRSVSPLPSQHQKRGSNSSSDNLMIMKQYNSHANNLGVSNEEEDNGFQDDMQGNDVEEERMTVMQSSNVSKRTRTPSFNRGSGGSIVSLQPSSSVSSRKREIIKQGPIYKKTSNPLSPWKLCYAIIKNGTETATGRFSLYKDKNCDQCLDSFDMGELYPEIKKKHNDNKWELRLRFNDTAITLGTDDSTSHIDWFNALTSIMGKVSLASQAALTERFQTSEQLNRNLQSVANDLAIENTSLKEEVTALQESLEQQNSFFQQELMNKETEYKESLRKKERLFLQDLEEKEQDFQNELEDRQCEWDKEMEKEKKNLEHRCKIFDREASEWRNKYTELEKKVLYNDEEEKQKTKIEALEIEIRKWRNRVDELEHQQKQQGYKSERRMERGVDSYSNISSSSSRGTAALENDSSALKETLTDVKFNLQILRDQIKTSSNEGPLADIKVNVTKLCDTLEEAKSGWTELQGDIVKFLESEKEDLGAKDANQKHAIELLRNDFVELREELIGITSCEADQEKDTKKVPSLSEKFDILIEMVENIQIGQSRLSSIVDTTSNSSSSESTGPITPTSESSSYQLIKAVTLQQQQISDWIEESRQIHNSTIEKLDFNNTRQNRALPTVPSDISKLHENITIAVEAATKEIFENQKVGQEDHEKQIKVIGSLLQKIAIEIQNSSIPDLPALSEQLEDVVERLNSTEEKLSMLKNFSGRANSSELMNISKSMPSFDQASDMPDNDKIAQIYNFIRNTELFMEQSLQTLKRYGNANGDNMDETIRRAVKSASRTQLEELHVIQEQNEKVRRLGEEKMELYEENARKYFDKSMENMKGYMEEYTTVMLELFSTNFVKAINQQNTAIPSLALKNNESSQDGDASSQQLVSAIELYGKLSGAIQVLKTEIERLEVEKEHLDNDVSGLKKNRKELEKQVEIKRDELRSAQSEYEHIARDVQRSRQEASNNLSRELEPLILQISKLKNLAMPNNEVSSDDISGDYEILSKKQLPPQHQIRSRSPLPHSYSSYDQNSIKSPLIGSREIPKDRMYSSRKP